MSPVQQLFLSNKTINRPNSYYQYLDQITDIFDLSLGTGYLNGGADIVKLRSKLAMVTTAEVQTRLWSRGNATLFKGPDSWTEDSHGMPQQKGQNTLINTTGNPDLFWVQLPSTTNTGLVQQFAPRINSTAKYETVTDGMLPTDCNSSSNAFYTRYMYQYYEAFGYDVEICTPGNMTISPWKNQRSRQDFGEDLYLRMNFSSNGSLSSPRFVKSGIWTKKLSLNTTFGNFELPNYANGGTPGPLIDGNPYPRDNETEQLFYKRDMVNDTSWNIYKATDKLTHSGKKGPLLSTALALFGEGSLVDAQHTSLAAYARSDVPYLGCIGTFPFVSLFEQSGGMGIPTPFGPCLDGEVLQMFGDDGDAAKKKESLIQSLIASYFFLFTGDYSDGQTDVPDDLLENAFASSAFLANDAMMMSSSPSRLITYVLGVDMQIPSISRAGMIFVSILLGLNILCLLAMAIYSAWIPRWTVTLDSFAMMRVGASISEKVPLLATNHVERLELLDETPGWIGNQAEEGLDQKGQLRLGGARPLKETKYYAGYETDGMGQSSAWKEPFRAIKRRGYALAQSGESAQHSSQV